VWVSALASNGTTLFAGTAHPGLNEGNVFRSTDFGVNWGSRNSDIPYLQVQSFAIIDANIFVSSVFGGVYRSTNNGTNWTAVNSGLSTLDCYPLVVSGQNLFVGTYWAGVFRSTNNGASWTAAGLGNQFPWSFAVSGNILFAGCSYATGHAGSGGVFRSTDNGTSWTAAGLTGRYVSGLAVKGTDLFATTRDGVSRSTNNGDSWVSVGAGIPVNTDVYSIVTVGENLFVGTVTAGVGPFLSTNNGTSWTAVNTGLTTGSMSGVFAIIGTDLFLGSYGEGVWRRPLSEMIPSVNDGLLAYYPFNANANDESGNGNSGTVHGATLTTDRFGIANSAYRFSGVAWIEVPSNPVFNISGDMTMSAWYRTDTTGYVGWGMHLMGKRKETGGTPDDFWSIGHNVVARTTTFGLYHNPWDYDYHESQNKIRNNVWQHIVVVVASNVSYIYFDGVLDSSSPVTTSRPSNGDPFTIGWNNDDNQKEGFVGSIDQVRVYGRALSSSEIQALYHEGDNGLVAYYAFNSNANDSSGNGNHGTAVGATPDADRFGHAGSSYFFNGSASIDIPFLTALNGLPQASISVWLKPGNDGVLLAHWSTSALSGPIGIFLSLESTGQVYMALVGGADIHTQLPVFTKDVWQMLTLVFNGSEPLPQNRLKLLINGNMVDINFTPSNSNLPASLGSQASYSRIGAYNLGDQGYFHGNLDDFRIYSRALSALEIDSLYHEGGYPSSGLPSWNFTNTGVSHTIIIPTAANPSINGTTLIAGDYVGVFYDSSGTLACAGYERWIGTSNIAISGFGDDPMTGVKDGMGSGELFKWKVFRASEKKVYDAEATYTPVGGVVTSTNTYTTNGISQLASLFDSSPWKFTNTGISHTIIVPTGANPNINGTALIAGDYIGVFYDSLGALACAGYERWTGSGSIAVSAFGDDPTSGAKDGLLAGEVFKWRMYRASEVKVYDAEATYTPIGGVVTSGNTYTTNGISQLTSLVGGIVTQCQNLRAGWSLISSYVTPQKSSLDSIFKLVRSDVIIIKNGAQKTYLPSIPVNTIGPWVNTEGYQIKMSNTRTLCFTGQKIVPETFTIPLPLGWSIMPYVRDSDLSITSAMSGVVADIVIVKDQDGKTYIPSVGVNGIGTLKVGQAYQIKMTTARTMEYPVNAASATIVSPRAKQSVSGPSWFFTNTGISHTFIVPTSVNPSIDGTPLVAGDYIGVFYDSSGTLACAGYEPWTGTSNMAIAAFGDDATTAAKDGLASGETLRWKLWRQTDGRVFVARASYIAQGGMGGIVTDTSQYNTNGISAVSTLTGSLTSVSTQEMPTQYTLAQNYPNPFNPTTTIQFGLPKSAFVSLRVFNTLGEQVADLVAGDREAGYHSVTFDASGLSSGVYFYRIEAENFVQTRKLLMVR
jgi:hypothetical protein